jgi:hypothetical protein
MFESKIETHTFKAKTILLTCDKFANIPISKFKSFNINDNIEYVLGITEADELVKFIAWFRKVRQSFIEALEET